MIKKEEFTFLSEDGKSEIHAIQWIPEGTIKGVLQMIHGMTEYIDRYDMFARYLADRGILVVGHDHLGHGKSVKSKKNLGYFADKRGCGTLIEDIRLLYKKVKGENPLIPYFVLGHSMGSMLLRRYICQYGTEISGAIVMGTGNKPRAAAKFGKVLTSVMAVFKGWRYRSPLVNRMVLGREKEREGVNSQGNWLTKDQKIVDSYRADEYCGFVFTLNGFYGLFDVLDYLGDKKNLKKMPQNLPVLFVSGEEDTVGDCGKAVPQLVEQFRKLGMKDIRFKLYRGDRHEILNELDKKTVFADIYEWLNICAFKAEGV